MQLPMYLMLIASKKCPIIGFAPSSLEQQTLNIQAGVLFNAAKR